MRWLTANSASSRSSSNLDTRKTAHPCDSRSTPAKKSMTKDRRSSPRRLTSLLQTTLWLNCSLRDRTNEASWPLLMVSDFWLWMNFTHTVAGKVLTSLSSFVASKIAWVENIFSTSGHPQQWWALAISISNETRWQHSRRNSLVVRLDLRTLLVKR